MKNKALIIFGILLLTSGVYASKSKKISVKVNNTMQRLLVKKQKILHLIIPKYRKI